MRYGRIHAACVLVALAGTGSGALAKNQAVEYMKYLSPMPQKNYLNESQDRLIKKQNFKAAALPDFPSVRNKECGFFAVVPPDKLSDNEFLAGQLDNEKSAGLSVTIPWKVLEPGEEKYDWTTLDNLLDLCGKRGKLLIVRVSTCGVDTGSGEGGKIDSDTPAWVFEAGTKSVKYLDKAGKPHLMPVFWDQNYLAAFSNFITEMGSRYDKNQLIHSVGITGGGFRGGTALVPTTINRKGGEKTATNETGFTSAEQIESYLKKEHGLSQKQIIDHWKYVADLFPQAFPNTALNFAINPPTLNRAGEDALDQISDYLIYRYGQHIYITRQDIKDGKHGFDDWRVMIKFKPDTYVGLAMNPGLTGEDMEKISKTALDDGISFIEIQPDVLSNKDEVVAKAVDKLHRHLGYQLVTQKAAIPREVGQGEALKPDFTFLNVGAAMPKRAVREMDKDVASSYKLMLEIKDASGKTIAQLLRTPEKGTVDWKAGAPVVVQDPFKMPKLPTGEYQAVLSVYDPEKQRKLNFLDGRSEKPVTTDSIALGSFRVIEGTTAPKVLESMKDSKAKQR